MNFIDFIAAFDEVWRVGLWQKLIQNGIAGKCFDVIVKMYLNVSRELL